MSFQLKSMKKNIASFLITCLFFVTGFTQEYNQLNIKGEKTGYWKIFLDKNVNPTDSLHAVFWGYEFFDNGKVIGEKFKPVKKSKYEYLQVEGMIPVEGNPVMLNGTLRWYYKRHGQEQILSEDTFKNGFAITLKEFTNNQLTALMDFTKHYHQQEGSCYIIGYDNSVITQCRWYRKEGNKWESVQTDCE